MNTPVSSPPGPAGGPDDTLDHALHGWVATTLPDDGFTLGVMQRVARWRKRPGLQPADAWAQLRVDRLRTARRARLTGLGLASGLAVAATWLLAFEPGTDALMSAAGPWALALASALGGLAGATAWLAQWSD